MSMNEALRQLAETLAAVVMLDAVKSYDQRNRAVVEAVYLALFCGYTAGFRFDPQEPEWPVAYIELPHGQVSWHLPQHVNPWDGHTTEEKNNRIALFCKEYQ